MCWNKVFVNGECVESFDCKLGVRQGDCLSPFLFAMDVNDMEQNLTESGIRILIGDMRISMLFHADYLVIYPDSKVHGANMGPTWVLSAPDVPHVGPTNLAIRV